VNGVDFPNSHALFRMFTTPHSSAIATGHQLGDAADYRNTVDLGSPIFNYQGAPGTQTQCLENNPMLADVDDHVIGGNYLNEESLVAPARGHGYQITSVGKLGPVGYRTSRS